MTFIKTNKAESFEVTKPLSGQKVASISELPPMDKEDKKTWKVNATQEPLNAEEKSG